MGCARSAMRRDATAGHLASVLVAATEDQEHTAAPDIESAKVPFIDHDGKSEEAGVEIQRAGKVVDFQAGFQKADGWIGRLSHGKS